MIERLSHITFLVRDLNLMARFSEFIFDAKKVYCSGNKTFSISKEKFFVINNIWVAVMEGELLSERTYNHVAFKIADSELEKYRQKIKSFDVEFRECRERSEGEGNSLYFYDYDNHLFELHTGTLEQRLAIYIKHCRYNLFV